MKLLKTPTNDQFLSDTKKDEKRLVLVGRPSLAASRWRARRPAPLIYFQINNFRLPVRLRRCVIRRP
jgi:hypothetical protein